MSFWRKIFQKFRPIGAIREEGAARTPPTPPTPPPTPPRGNKHGNSSKSLSSSPATELIDPSLDPSLISRTATTSEEDRKRQFEERLDAAFARAQALALGSVVINGVGLEVRNLNGAAPVGGKAASKVGAKIHIKGICSYNIGPGFAESMSQCVLSDAQSMSPMLSCSPICGVMSDAHSQFHVGCTVSFHG